MARKNGAVVLREWPRMRYSQKYSRDAGPNPAEISHSYEEFLEIVDVIFYFIIIHLMKEGFNI